MHLLVLGEYGQFVFQLLAKLQADSKEHKGFTQPRNRSLGLVYIELDLARGVFLHIINGTYQFVRLDIETDSQIAWN